MSAFDFHLWTIVIIMIVTGIFGGYLNYLHKFDISEEIDSSSKRISKYIFLGIGSAFLVPAFLKMIASDLIKDTEEDNLNYLIFTGFCLIAAIFSRRFISTIGDRILEAAKNAELSSREARKEIESTKLQLNSTQERIEDVKAAVNLNVNQEIGIASGDEALGELLILVNGFVDKTSISDYSERLKMKAELGRRMAQIIIRNNLPKNELLDNYPQEGIYLALAYSVELRPENKDLIILNRVSKIASQLYTKYIILIAYRTLAHGGFISKDQVKEIFSLVDKFRVKADKALLNSIDDTISVLKFIDPDI